MRIESARTGQGELILKTTDPNVRRFVYEFKPGEYEIVKAKKKRSLDANAYAWVLIDKLANSLSYTKQEIYRNAIRDIGGNSDTVCVKEEAVEKLCSGWEKRGLGWQTEVFDSKIAGCKNVTLYYGSSFYDTHQMTRLIDHLVSDCKTLGIETMTYEELESLMRAWQ